MTRARIALLLALVGAALLAGWRMVGILSSDAALRAGDPAAALRWRPGDVAARWADARRAREDRDPAAIEAAARRLLGAAPADGRGYRLLAEAAVASGQPAQALHWYRVAAARAPRDVPARAWLAQHALESGDVDAALVQIDQVLTLSPAAGRTAFPVLAQLARDPRFATRLAARLAARPAWRGGMLAALQGASPDGREAMDQVLSALHRQGGLDDAEFDAWIDALMHQGRWGEAHARWFGARLPTATRIPLLYNGDWRATPRNAGFDWRIRQVPGVLVEVHPGQDRSGDLHVRLLGRRVVETGVEHAVLLPPGHYRLDWRERSQSLRATRGLGWRIACANGRPLAASAPLDGSRPWREQHLGFQVPAQECPGAWLRLGSGGEGGGGQVASGEAWFSDVRLARDPSGPPTP